MTSTMDTSSTMTMTQATTAANSRTSTSSNGDDAMMTEVIMTDDTEDIEDAMMAAFLQEYDDSMVDSSTAGIGVETEIDTEIDTEIGNTTTSTSTATNVRQVSDSTGSATSAEVAATATTTAATTTPVLTGRPSIPLYLSCNPDHLSEYQCLIRKHIELFEAGVADVNARVKGRNKPIVLGQVGIRCMHCRRSSHNNNINNNNMLPHQPRQEEEQPALGNIRGSVYYPHTLVGIYQAAQILSQGHLLELCPFLVDTALRRQLVDLKSKKSQSATAGKEYWANTAKALGVYEDQYGLRFEERLGMVRHT
jgi:hypothetical protein